MKSNRRAGRLAILLMGIGFVVAVTGCGGGGGGGGGDDRAGATVTGNVRIECDGDLGPAVGARVIIASQVGVTDSGGRFIIQNVPVSATQGTIERKVGDGTNGWYEKKFNLPPLQSGRVTDIGTVRVTSNSCPPPPPDF